MAFTAMDLTMGPQPLPSMPTPQFPQMPGMAKPTGMFGAGGVGRNILGMIGDFLMARAGMQPIYAPTMAQRQQLMMKAALEKQERQQEFQDQRKAHQQDRQFDIDNPLPQQPGEFEQALIASGVQPGTPQWAQAMQTRTQNILDPVVMTAQGPMLRSQLLGGGSAGQPAAPGVTFTPIDGGPTPPASGGFHY